jgi:phosphatidylserine/phosphatidylglycerophosphate/cardiolipin synthase-like enzyme
VLAADVLDYWLEQGISPRLHGPVIGLIEAITAGRVQVRIHPDPHRMLHAKVYVGADAATMGSSNFSQRGLGGQTEANSRFERRTEPDRYRETALTAENYWAVGTDWNTGFIQVLRTLLAEVSWREALARACSDLLNGDWAADLLDAQGRARRPLWPSQRAGIAQSLWVLESSGGVLIADATG